MPDCIHHWIIEQPDGPFSKGCCCKCKAEQMFSNTFIPEDIFSCNSWKKAHHKGTKNSYKRTKNV